MLLASAGTVPKPTLSRVFGRHSQLVNPQVQTPTVSIVANASHHTGPRVDVMRCLGEVRGGRLLIQARFYAKQNERTDVLAPTGAKL